MLEVNNLRVEYQKNTPTLDQYNLTVNEGELVSLLGPSGCGKTTTLRTVAGFIEPAAGQITLNTQDITYLPPNKRDIGLVFQSYALFPHMTVSQNIAFGLKMRGINKADIAKRVDNMLRMVDLEAFSDRRPAQLSGGQQQRVALARAVIIEPQLLLLDEPLSNLDAKLRVSMRTEIRRLQQRLGVTTLYVTHDQEEALAISDRVIVMDHGRIEQDGTPEAIYSTPHTGFVADFMGFDNHFQTTIEQVDEQYMGIQVIDRILKVPISRMEAHSPKDNIQVDIYFRSNTPNLSTEARDHSINGNIVLHTFQGDSIEYIVETDIGELTIRLPQDAPRFAVGSVFVNLNPQSLIVLPTD